MPYAWHILPQTASVYYSISCCDGSNWDSHLPFTLFAYRTSIQESTKESPFFLLYGRDAKLPSVIIEPPQSDRCLGILFASTLRRPKRHRRESITDGLGSPPLRLEIGYLCTCHKTSQVRLTSLHNCSMAHTM